MVRPFNTVSGWINEKGSCSKAGDWRRGGVADRSSGTGAVLPNPVKPSSEPKVRHLPAVAGRRRRESARSAGGHGGGPGRRALAGPARARARRFRVAFESSKSESLLCGLGRRPGGKPSTRLGRPGGNRHRAVRLGSPRGLDVSRSRFTDLDVKVTVSESLAAPARKEARARRGHHVTGPGDGPGEVIT